jgi:CheY-like chemotaxis protein
MHSTFTPDEPKRVLVIDDEEDVRELLRTVLDDAGYVVETAINGADGLAKISVVQPDLVLLDLNMPVLDGWEVLERLPRLSQPPVVVIISAYVEDWRALRAGAWECLRKPFQVRDLLATCTRALAAAGAVR